MTLKEKFTNSIVLPFEYEEKIKKSLAIADEFAMKFGEHILDYHNDVTSDYLPLILEQFKKEKGL